MGRSDDDDWTRACRGNGKIDPILGLAKSNRLHTRRSCSRFSDVRLWRRRHTASLVPFVNVTHEPMAFAGQG
jgi:hypothetical protein